ncbi:anthranilate phosphoribosyltransferase [Pseudonocardia hierapolitana]|uniref:Anthranilate phosphoribosyltransferase n=1 Tax=Pseudonocardia hierapolitana TaxID=1128676 RepID=A0A561STN5_9PSEU|nr:anthranilate phosphoribosyltransferase [Pseudonocardia hierapolitana]TWF78233.1 anthranilate phosphoribosyltransferase [Pseudonocardia hierapolitana]
MARLFPTVLAALIRGDDLPAALTERVMDEIVSDAATPAQIAAFAVLLRAKGETADEITGLVASLMRHATPVPIDGHAVDVVGTGGDGADTVNVSTMAALVVAGTGRRVVKHGARSASSACGAADVLEELGVRIDLPAAGVARTVTTAGIGFCFAPVFQPGLRHTSVPRRQIGVPTVFNLLGPLINPARPPASLIGCADPGKAPLLAQVFADRGVTALVVRGDDGLDELTTTTTSTMWIADGGGVERVRVDPAALGIPLAPAGALRGGDRVHNAAIVRAVLGGQPGPVRDAVLLNAAAAIVAHDGAHPALEAFPDALALAGESIDSGAAARTLDAWTRFSPGS